MNLSAAQQEAHDALLKEMEATLGGVNPPDAAEAAAGTMRDVPDDVPADPASDQVVASGDPSFDLPKFPPRAPSNPPAPPADQIDFSGSLDSVVPERRAPAAQGVTRQPRVAPVDTELMDAQRNAKDRRATASIGNAITAFTERPTNALDYMQRLGGGGVSEAPKHNTMWDDYEGEGNQAVKDLMARRASESDLLKKQKASEDEAAMDDPNSPESLFAVSLIQKNAPGLDVAGRSASQIGKFAPFVLKAIEENGAAIKAKAAADLRATEDARREQMGADKAKAKDEKEATDSKNWRSQMETRYPEEIGKLPPGVWDSATMKVGQDLQNGWETDRQKAAAAKAKNKGGGAPPSIAKAGDLNTVPADIRAQVEAIANGQQPAVKGKSGMRIMAAVSQYKPDYDPSNYDTYHSTKADQSKNPALIAIKTAYKHMDEALSAIDDLGNTQSPTWNKVANWASAGSGSAKTMRARTALQAVGSEAAKAYGENDVAGREHVHALTDLNQSPEQIRANLGELKTLLGGKEEVFNQNLSAVTPEAFKKKAAPAAPAPAVQAAPKIDHYLVNPAKTRRVPVFADGTEGEEEAVP